MSTVKGPSLKLIFTIAHMGITKTKKKILWTPVRADEAAELLRKALTRYSGSGMCCEDEDLDLWA